jgi:hypothetical protein
MKHLLDPLILVIALIVLTNACATPLPPEDPEDPPVPIPPVPIGTWVSVDTATILGRITMDTEGSTAYASMPYGSSSDYDG